MKTTQLVSVHGGHSGQFCSHAQNSLEEIITAYIAHGFSWVGITEHAPGISQELLYADQQALGLTPESLLARFARYMEECRRLQAKYASQIRIFAAMETETYSGYQSFIPYLTEQFQPDYLVGSVHFVGDRNFDYSQEKYDEAASALGGYDALYCQYFDDQYEMIEFLKPSVVGHFDLIRIFDPGYRQRLRQPAIHQRVIRNLELIKKLGLILDFNLRALLKGATEPYITESLLKLVHEMDIAIAPGDDSHGVANIGLHMNRAIEILEQQGITYANWPVPVLASSPTANQAKQLSQA